MAKTSFLTQEDKWINKHFEELVDTYAGQYVAVVGEEIAGVGSTPWEVEKEAKKKYPSSRPSVLKVPRPQDFVSILMIVEKINDPITLHALSRQSRPDRTNRDQGGS